MALSTTQYGYIIDPMVPFTDDKGKTIKNGFVRVFVAGSSTPVVTYRNFDGAANQDLIELDNSGRTKTNVIGSKGLTYKVCVYDQLHSQESPILTVDKVSVIGANITAGAGATLVTGLDGLTTKPDGFVDASVVGTDGYVAIDHTLVTDDLDTDAKVTAVEDDRYIPLLNEDVNDPDSKMTLGRLWQWVLGKIKSLSTTITVFRSGDVIPVDGPSGTAKMSKDDLLKETAQNAMADNIAPEFDPTKPNGTDGYAYHIGDSVVHEGKNYTFISNHPAGAWNASDVIQTSIISFVKNVVHKLTSVGSSEVSTGNDLLDFSDENGNVFSFYDSNGVFHALLVDDAPDGDLLDICDANGYVIAYFDDKGFFHANTDFLVDNLGDDLVDFCDADGNTFAFWDSNGYLHSKRVGNAELMLPDKINSWNSDPLQIFKYPATLEEYFGVNAVNFYIKTNSNSVRKCGKDLRRYFECKGLSSGTYKIGANIVDRNFNVIAEKEITLSVLSPSSPLTMKNILLIGDSETEGITNNSGISVAQGASEEGTFPYANELKRLLTTSTSPDGFPTGLNLSNVQLIGTRNTSDGRHEGYGGQDVNFFLGNTSPFYVGGKIDFNAYLAQDSVYGDTIHKGVDVIYILLGANVGNSVSIDDNGKLVFDGIAYKTQLIPLIEKIKEQLVDDSSAVYYNPDLKIVLLSYALPWIDGYGYHPYGSSQFTDGIYNARKYITYKLVNDELAKTYGTLVESVMVSQMIDSENCYAYIENKKNAYSSETELNHIEAVHPNRNGYRLYAQAVARDFVGRI